MDWSGITSLPGVGWPTAIAMAIALTGLLLGARYESRRRAEKELQDAEHDYRAAVVSRDPDRIALAGRRLQDARRKAS